MAYQNYSGRFGISISNYIKNHENEIKEQSQRYKRAEELGTPLRSGEIKAIREKHLLMIGRLQHERLIHLIVTSLVALLFALFATVILLVPVQPLVLFIPLILGILLVAYLRHYFLLENAVQRWYLLDDELHFFLADTIESRN